MVKDGLTFTLVATSEQVATIDAAQYLDGGPCVDVANGSDVLDVEIPDLLDEGRWSAFARTSAAHGVRSTLSLPIVRNGQLLGGVNLYAADSHAFEGRHEALAMALGASAVGAVADADLEFTSRARAIADAGDHGRPAHHRHGRRDPGRAGPHRRRHRQGPPPGLGTRAGVTLVQAAAVVSYLRAKRR